MITREPVLTKPEGNNPLQGLGYGAFKFWQHAGRASLITLKAFGYFRNLLGKRSRREWSKQMYACGVRSLGVVSIVALFTGMIFALQVGLQLQTYGQEAEVGAGVALVMFREMGPFMAALIIAASYGSSVAAQLGTMTVSEEIAALEIMAIDPVKFLVMPRLAALIVIMPLLAFFTSILAIFGGMLVAKTQLQVTALLYLDSATIYLAHKDVYVGLFKATVFGVVICTVACYQGFLCSGGAVGVGRATRKTVVMSFITVLIIGYIITRLCY